MFSSGAADGNIGSVAPDGVVLGIGASTSSERWRHLQLKTAATYWAYTDKTNVYFVDEDHKTITRARSPSVSTDLNDLVYAGVNSVRRPLTDVVIVEKDEVSTTTYSVALPAGPEV